MAKTNWTTSPSLEKNRWELKGMAVVSCVAFWEIWFSIHSLLAIQASSLPQFDWGKTQEFQICVTRPESILSGLRWKGVQTALVWSFFWFELFALPLRHYEKFTYYVWLVGIFLGKISRSIGLYFSAVSWLPQRNTCELPKILLLSRLDCTESWTFCSFTEQCSQNLTPFKTLWTVSDGSSTTFQKWRTS